MRYDTKSARRKFWFEVFVPILNLFHLDHWVWKRYVEKRYGTPVQKSTVSISNGLRAIELRLLRWFNIWM